MSDRVMIDRDGNPYVTCSINSTILAHSLGIDYIVYDTKENKGLIEKLKSDKYVVFLRTLCSMRSLILKEFENLKTYFGDGVYAKSIKLLDPFLLKIRENNFIGFEYKFYSSLDAYLEHVNTCVNSIYTCLKPYCEDYFCEDGLDILLHSMFYVDPKDAKSLYSNYESNYKYYPHGKFIAIALDSSCLKNPNTPSFKVKTYSRNYLFRDDRLMYRVLSKYIPISVKSDDVFIITDETVINELNSLDCASNKSDSGRKGIKLQTKKFSEKYSGVEPHKLRHRSSYNNISLESFLDKFKDSEDNDYIIIADIQNASFWRLCCMFQHILDTNLKIPSKVRLVGTGSNLQTFKSLKKAYSDKFNISFKDPEKIIGKHDADNLVLQTLFTEVYKNSISNVIFYASDSDYMTTIANIVCNNLHVVVTSSRTAYKSFEFLRSRRTLTFSWAEDLCDGYELDNIVDTVSTRLIRNSIIQLIPKLVVGTTATAKINNACVDKYNKLLLALEDEQ